jgi:hypothetical protein
LPGADAEYHQAYLLAAPYMSADQAITSLNLTGPSPEGAALAHQILALPKGDLYTVNNACWQLIITPGEDPGVVVQALQTTAASGGDCAVTDTYAWALYLSGRRAEAARQEQRALDNSRRQDPADVPYYLGCLEGMQGNTRQAQEDLRNLFQQNITFTSAWNAANCFAN